MEFLKMLNEWVIDPEHNAAAEKWWNSLKKGGKACELNFKKISKCELFGLEKKQENEFVEFTRRLHELSTSGDSPNNKARWAINGRDSLERTVGTGEAIMVCKGEKAKNCPEALFRIVAARSFWHHHVVSTLATAEERKKNRYEDNFSDLYPLEAWWKSASDKSVWETTVGGKVRGKLVNVFWAALNDIEVSLEDRRPFNLRDILDLLGIKPETLDRHVELKVKKEDLPAPPYVPTSWDGFDNEHFFPQPKINGVYPETGWTRDLRDPNSPDKRGAREVVSKPVEITKLVPGDVLV